MTDGTLWIGSIVIDTREFETMREFWQRALGYVPREAPEEGSVVLKDPAGIGPNIALNRSGEPPLEEYRLHLDLYCNDVESEVRRLLGLGASLRHAPRPDEDFTTLADPDGNLFDVIDKRGWSAGRFS